MSFYDINDALFGTGKYGSARYGIVSPNVSITGVSATGAIQAPSIGGLEVDISEVLTSVSATSSLGTIIPRVSDSVTLTGVSTVIASDISTGVSSRLISVAAADEDFYTERTADISAYIGATARLVVLYQSGSSFRGDVQLDDFNIGGNTFTDFSSSQSFETNNAADNSKVASGNLDNIQSELNNVTFQSVGTSTSAFGKWVRDASGTPSGGTGLTSGNTGSFYLYAETSSSGSNNDIWLRSPSVTINNGTLSFFSAQSGSNCGPFFAYLDVSSAPASSPGAVAGTVQVNIQEDITGVSATGFVNSVVISRVVTISGVAGTSALGSIEPQITEDITGVSATGGIGTFTFANTVGPTGIVGTTNSPALQVNIQEDIVGISATSAVGSVTTATAAGLTGVSATGAVSGLSVGQFEIDVSEVIPTGVSATGAVQQIIPSSVVGLTGVSATGAVSSLATGQFEVDVTDVLTAVVATGAAGSAGVGIGVTPTGVVGNSGLTAVSVNIKKVPTGVVGTSSAGALKLNPTAGLDGVEATGTAGSILVGASENIESVSATSSIGTISINVKKLLTSLLGTATLGSITSTGVIFDFDTVKDLYGRKRIVYVEGFTEQSKERRIYVPNENRTVSVEKVGLNRRTIFVPQENRKVYIQPYSTSAERRVRAA